jgi:DNA-binding NarL/FixJ family response regulator
VRKSILIVDDHPVLRHGLAALIESDSNFTVCGQVATAAATFESIREQLPDLAIVDLGLEGSDGLDLIKQMKAHYPEIPVLVLSMHDETLYAERALRVGARGYVTKQQMGDTVLDAIRRVLCGEVYLSSQLVARFASKYLGGRTLAEDSPLHALSDRELQVFRLIGQGRSTRQIAGELNLSVKTIESHNEHIKQKLRLVSATELAHRATKWAEFSRSD